MEKSVLKQFSFDFKNVLIDEIALGGLEGIGLNFLWRRLKKRMESPVTGKMRARFWTFLVNCDAITFYQLPEPLPRIEVVDRFELIDEDTGYIREPEEYLDGTYEYCPIDNEYGSSKYYNTRVLIPKETLQNQTYDMVFETFGDTLAMVASLEERFHALAPHASKLHLKELSKAQYCMLELIGRARENGQMCIGKTNIMKIIKDPKLIFYNRKFLQNHDLVKIRGIHQVAGPRAIITLLMTLKRFHKPFLQALPKHGKWLNIIQHLLEQPDYKDDAKIMMNQGFFTLRYCKRLFRTHNVFVFENKEGADEKKGKEMAYKTIRMELPSEESSQSDTEGNEETLKSQYKIKVSLIRQAYELIVKSGAEGRSLMQLAELLGLEFYAIRTICRALKAKKIVKEYFVDVGRQKVARFIALPAASSSVDALFEIEKKKYLEHLEDGKNSECSSSKPAPTAEEAEDTEDDIPLKKLKQESDITDFMPDSKTIEKRVSEIKHVDGFENDVTPLLGAGKLPTLRQLKYANGILKVIKEKRIVTGWQFLNQLVSRKISEPLLDGKRLKVLVQRLISDGQIKAIKMTWPIHQKTCVLFCAPNVPANDPQIKEKYREINLVALRNKREEKKLFIPPPPPQTATRPLAMSIYPRYLKIQKLHEAIMKFVCFNNTEHKPSTPPGFCALIDLIPEFTVDFVLGNMSSTALMEMIGLKIPNHLINQKIRDIPADLLKVFLTSYNLQNMWKMNLKNLAMLGLIQLIKQPNRSDDSYTLTYEFFVNPRVQIVNTAGDWPRPDEDKKPLEKCYHFQSFKDVENFWKDVYHISINTTIVLDREQRVRKYPLCSPVFRDQVKLDGCSEIMGDGNGPCGFDSSYHMEKPRSWALCHTKLKQQALLKYSLPKMPKHKKIKTASKPKVPKKKLKPKKPIPVINKPLVQKPEEPKTKQKSYTPKWTKDEDIIIMLCKAAITVMSPTRTVGCLKIRNLAAKDILSIYDTTKKASYCHKRALLQETNTTFTYEKDCIINELKRYPNILKKYENMIKTKLRQQCNGSMTKIYHATRLHLLELVWIMLQLYQSESFKRKTPCVALNLDEFHEKFVLSPSTINLNFNVYRTPLADGPVMAAIKEGIMVAVISSFKMNQSAEVSQGIHSMFSPFTEEVLRPAMDHLRKAGVVAAKEKIMVANVDKFHAQDMVKTSFKLSSSYQRRWLSRLNSEFVDNVVHDLNANIPKINIKGSSELNCILMELNTCGIVDLVWVANPSIAGPTGSLMQEEQLSVQDMMMKFKLKSGALNWSSKREFEKFSDLLDVDFRNSWDEILSNSELKESVQDAKVEDQSIINILESKQEQGSTFQEIQNATGYNTKTLVDKLKAMESSHIIKRVGYYENVIVLTKYAKPWTLPLRDKHIIPTPWLTLDMDIRSDIFLKWSGTIMNKVFMNPGCSISYLSEEVEFLSARATQDICMLLANCKCVALKCAKENEPDLFSECDVVPVLEDFHEYESVHNIFVFPEKDAIITYATLKRKMREEDPYCEET